MKYLPVLLFAFAMGLTACDDGPAESFGEGVDDFAQDTGNAVEDLCEDATDDDC